MRNLKIEFTDACIVMLTLEHNGVQGGDAGHGGFVNILVADEGGTNMELNGKPVDKFRLEIKGDAERRVFSRVFRAIAEELDNHPVL